MGYLFKSMMRDYDRNRRAHLKAAERQRAEKTAARYLNRLIAGVRCPQCWQEAYVAKYVPLPGKVPANAGVRLRALPAAAPVPPTVLCTCPDGHQWMVRNGQLLPCPPQPGRRVR